LEANRDANGNLIPNPQKFPNGLAPVFAHIHAHGLKAGLYTARGHNTCAGYMGACGHEAHDAAWYAAQGIDYLKDDDCGGCSDYCVLQL
jgi:alpha-galactosidase